MWQIKSDLLYSRLEFVLVWLSELQHISPRLQTENSNVLDARVVLNYLDHGGHTLGLRFRWIHWNSLGAMDIVPSLSTET
jgi:predicted Zn-dependent protease